MLENWEPPRATSTAAQPAPSLSTVASLGIGVLLAIHVYIIFAVGIFFSHGEFLVFFPEKLWKQLHSHSLIELPYRFLGCMGLAVFLLHTLCSFSRCRTCSCLLFCVYLVVEIVVVSACTVALRSI